MRSTNLRAWLVAGVALTALTATSAAQAQSAQASGAGTVEEVVVTGTSIRGAAPVGSNVIAITQQDIQATGAQTVQQLLTSVPSVSGFGNAAQGGFGSGDGAGTFAPTIHSLGQSASNQTLVLIDGHRLPLSGLTHALADPNVIPPAALERVEVLPDGASSIYGSDAVAGVLNFITRRKFTGIEVSGQAGYAKDYNTANFNAVVGETWDKGSVLLAYGWSYRSNLANADRDFINPNQTARGGGNFGNYLCPTATVQGGPGNLVYQYPYTAGTGLAASAPGPCATTKVGDLLPMESRNSVLFKAERDITDALTVSADLVYSGRVTKSRVSRGTVQGTVYGPGSTPPGGAGQINPFFRGPPGATSATVRWSADELLGTGAENRITVETVFATLGAEYKLGKDWVLEAGMTIGTDTSTQRQTGLLCGSCALLGLNGTVLQNASVTTSANPPSLGTSTITTRLPLTTANALDVFSPAGQNRTSAAVIAQLTDSKRVFTGKHSLENFRLKADGTLFELPGGPVKAAIGAESISYVLDQYAATPSNAGPASVATSYLNLRYERKVRAAFAELLVPIIGESNALPLVQALDVSLSGRYDKYSDFGVTKNPRIAATWKVIDGLQFRGSWGTSFTAPAVTSTGDANGVNGETMYGGISPNTVVPLNYPGASGLPSCTPTGCPIGPAVQGVRIAGGNKDLKAQTGETFSVGFDFRPTFLPGLTTSLTYWYAKNEGLVTVPQLSSILTTPSLYNLFIINPTPAQLAAVSTGVRQDTVLPGTIYYLQDQRQQNAFNLRAAGIDADIRYRLATDETGDFVFGLNFSNKLKFDSQAGDGALWFDRLNVSGVSFSSLKFQGRGSLGWRKDGFSADVFVNYVNGYTNLGGQAPFQVTTVGNTVTGGQKIDSFTTMNLNVSYDLPMGGMLSDTQVFGNIDNVFDKDPPFSNSAAGYNSGESNPLGRFMTIGVRKKW